MKPLNFILIAFCFLTVELGFSQSQKHTLLDSVTVVCEKIQIDDGLIPLFSSRGNVIGTYKRNTDPFVDIETWKGEITMNGNSFSVTSFDNATVSKDGRHVIVSGGFPQSCRGGSVYTEIYSASGEITFSRKLTCAAICGTFKTTSDGSIYYFGYPEFGDIPQQLTKMDINGKVDWQFDCPRSWGARILISPSEKYVLVNGLEVDKMEPFQILIDVSQPRNCVDIPEYLQYPIFLNDSVLFTSSRFKWKTMNINQGFKTLTSGEWPVFNGDNDYRLTYLEAKQSVVMSSRSIDSLILVAVHLPSGIGQVTSVYSPDFPFAPMTDQVVIDSNTIRFYSRESVATVTFYE